MTDEILLLWIFATPVIVFLAFVAPLWITFHYLTRWRQMKHVKLEPGFVAVERAELLRLRQTAGRLEERIATLEKILDQQATDWRDR